MIVLPIQMSVNIVVIIQTVLFTVLVILVIDWLVMVEHVMVSFIICYNSTIISCLNLEIDECSEGLSSCNQMCTNVIGSYYCICYSGFELLYDNYTCQGQL